MKHKIAARRHGFTLVEMLIVLVVIAIVALIVIPRVMGATRRSRESALRANLVLLRKAITQFESDTGVFPAVLQDIVALSSAQLNSGDTAIVHQLYQGPYIIPSGGVEVAGYSGLPANPFVNPNDTTVTDHWNYSVDFVNDNYSLTSAVSGTSMDGIAYTSL